MAGHFDYHRTVVGYHGTTRAAADDLVEGRPFGPSANEDDWLGHGVYFWEYGPRQAWRWADRRHGREAAAVVGAMIRLGLCLDLLDPGNVDFVRRADQQLQVDLREAGEPMPQNANARKFRDNAVFNLLHRRREAAGEAFDTTRAAFVPLSGGKLQRLWLRSGVFDDAHIQLCVRNQANILAVWHITRSGNYGKQDRQRRARPHPPA